MIHLEAEADTEEEEPETQHTDVHAEAMRTTSKITQGSSELWFLLFSA